MMGANSGAADQVRGSETTHEDVRKDQAEAGIEKVPVINAPKELNDVPKTLGELRQLNQENTLVTEAAWDYLVHPEPSNKGMCFHVKVRKTPFNEELWEVVIKRRFQSYQPQRQLTLAETKLAVRFLQEKRQKAVQEEQTHRELEMKKAEIGRQMRNIRPNSGIPKEMLDGEGKVVCARHRKIGYRFQAMDWNLILFKTDPTVTPAKVEGFIPDDPETGKPSRRGNFWVIVVDQQKGFLEPKPLCGDCGLEYKQELPSGVPDFMKHGHPYEIAIGLCDTKSYEMQKGIRQQEKFSKYAQQAVELSEDSNPNRNLKRNFRGGRR